MSKVTDVRVGDRVRWESAAGTIRGEILEIRLAQNANNELIPWLIIEFYNNNKACKTMLCGTEDYLKMMKFKVNFRDVEKQLMGA
jgi:hypothetical protein